MIKKQLVFFLIFFKLVVAQDVFYTQFQQSPLLISPSYSCSDVNLKSIFQYRQQYRIPGPNYYSPVFTFIFPFVSKKIPNKIISGFGIMAQSDQNIGFPNYESSRLSLNYAQNIRVGMNYNLALGGMVGIYNYSTGINNISTGNQYERNTGYNASLPNGENLSSYSFYMPDVGLGTHLSKLNNKGNVDFIASASVFHFINFSRNTQLSYILPLKISVHSGYTFYLKGGYMIMPEVYYVFQNNQNRVSIGAQIKYNLTFNKEEAFKSNNIQLVLIPRYFVNNYVALGVEFHLKRIIAGFSYDINASKNTDVLLTNGAYRLYIGYRQLLSKRKEFKDIPDIMDEDHSKTKSKNKSKKIKRGWKSKERYIKPND